MTNLNLIAESKYSTVLAEYKPAPRENKEYQSEADLERELIQNLQEQGYEYLTICSEKNLCHSSSEKRKSFNFSSWRRKLSSRSC